MPLFALHRRLKLVLAVQSGGWQWENRGFSDFPGSIRGDLHVIHQGFRG